MASNFEKSNNAIRNLNSFRDFNELLQDIENKTVSDVKNDRLPIELNVTEESTHKRLDFLKAETNQSLDYLTGKIPFEDKKRLEGNIENYIGMSMVPTGVIGPVRVIGSAAHGDYFVPLATSEGALVASYHRGAKACYLAGGATSVCLVEGVQRSPVFKFDNMGDLGHFVAWLLLQMDEFRAITSQASRYAKLMDMRMNIEGNHVILTFEFHTGDAAGQNMVTICTDQICKYIVADSPMKPNFWFLESNYSGDKKATSLSFSNVRGKKVTTEIILSEKIVNEVLKTTPELIAEYWRTSTLGIIQSGAIGAQGHYANGLTAMFIATGQDAACVAEAAMGITRLEHQKDGSLYASVTLPNLIVGTVGGGTGLPTQRECLELMGCYGAGNARKYAEICGAVILAGELSIAAALSAGHFSAAHQKFGRKSHK